MAWAFVEVEPGLDARPASWNAPTALFPVRHGHDFRAIDQAMQQKSLAMEVYVFHQPIKFPWYWVTRNNMPTMVVWLCRAEFQERCANGGAGAVRDDIVWKYEPLVDRFKGRWEYL